MEWLAKNYDFHITNEDNQAKTMRLARSPSVGGDYKNRSFIKSSSLSTFSSCFFNDRRTLKTSDRDELHPHSSNHGTIENIAAWMSRSGLSIDTLFRKERVAVPTATGENTLNAKDNSSTSSSQLLRKEEFSSALIKAGCPLPLKEIEFAFLKIDLSANGLIDLTTLAHAFSFRTSDTSKVSPPFQSSHSNSPTYQRHC